MSVDAYIDEAFFKLRAKGAPLFRMYTVWGSEVTSHQPAFEMARLLIGEGYDPETILNTWRGEKRYLEPATLSTFAGLTVGEEDKGGMRLRKYVDNVRWRNDNEH